MFNLTTFNKSGGGIFGLSLISVSLIASFPQTLSANAVDAESSMPSASVAPAPAKGRTVTGFVSDESGDPLPGASIALKGTKIGTVTDLNGLFSLVIPADFTNPQIEVSFVGMVSQTISVRGDKPLNIELSYNSSDLDEVVVIGYGTSKVRDLTGSVSRLTARDVEHSPMTSNVASMLQGKAAGVNVMISSASPTSPISVVIRGQSSLSGDGQPLWVIDGVPQYSSGVSGDVSNTLYNLNLNDVSSIDILKDASATAIYGSRAANGVVIVTTKSGSEGMKPTIEFSTRLGWQSINSNDFKTMDADQYKAFSKQANLLEAFRSGGLSYFNKKYMDQDKFNLITTSQWDMSDIADMWLPNAYYDGHDNYWDAMTQSALAQDYNVWLRGGSKTTSYYASVNFKDQDGIVKGSRSKYFGMRFNFETLVSEKLKFGLNMDASTRRADNKDNMIDKLIGMRPDYPMYNEDGEINTIDFYTKNPLVELQDKNHSDSKNFTGISFLEYNIMPWLKFRTTLNATYSNSDYDRFNRRYYSDDTNSGSRSNSQNYVIVWDNLLTFYKTMGLHDVQAMIGNSMERQSAKSFSASGSNFPDDDVLTNLGSAAIKNSIASSKYNSSLVSAFARVQYKFNDRYLLTGTFRADGSSKFGKDKRWGYFPSGAVGWIMSNEEFLKGLAPTLTYLKLRASYGRTGSQNLGYYDFISGIGSNNYNGEPGSYPTSLGNNTLQWESQSQTDVGVDYGFWDDRVRGSIGWYRKYVDNLITSRPVPTSSSFTSTNQNVGAISNTGLEFDITVSILRNRNLSWEVNFNAAHNKGRLEKLNGITTFLGGGAYENFKLTEGSELGTFYGYVDAGRLYQNYEEALATMPINPTTGLPMNYRVTSWTEGAGDVYLVDLDGDGKITADDRTYLGNCNPDVFGGFGSTLIWKGLMFNMTFSYGLGGKRYWVAEASKFGGVNVYNAPTFILDSWTMNQSGKYPVSTHYGMGQNSTFSNRWLHDASYLRLTALNVSYKLPQKWFRKFLVKGIEASFQATNLFTITKYPGMDPQGNFNSPTALYGVGYDYSSYPPARTYNFGLKFTID